MRRYKVLGIVAVVVALMGATAYVALHRAGADTPDVGVLELPRGGTMPDADIDRDGTLHVAFMIDQDVYYARGSGRPLVLGPPVRINQQAGTALGGMFRGPELAIAGDGSVDVVWYRRGWEMKLPPAEEGPMFSRRLPQGGFSAARRVFDRPTDGHSITTTSDGLLLAWKAGPSLWSMTSRDAGASFEAALDLGPLPCECCDTALAAGSDGVAYLAYRDRKDDIRDVFLLPLQGGVATRERLRLDDESWHFDGCPHSGMSLAVRDHSVYAVWEHIGSILLTRIDADRWSRLPPVRVTGFGKYPVIATDGATLLVAWKERKVLVWALYDARTLEVLRGGKADSSSSSRPAAVSLRDGTYVLIA